MTRDSERDHVRRWLETGRLLDDLRWRELRVLDQLAAWPSSGGASRGRHAMLV
ncbi:MAG TPA: hypothetical protein VNZ26_05145 [Vicinamibacterales bacterium]|nr:hypothetical protein [Vicinamibacterales bacterium]